MRPGPKIKSIESLKLTGTYQPVRHARRARVPEAAGLLKDSEPPKWLSAAQRRVWREVIGAAPQGVLRKADRRMFLSFIVLTEVFEQAVRGQNEIAKGTSAPLLVRGPAGAMLSPYFKAMISCAPRLVQLGAELGLTPVSRRQLGEPERPRERAEDDTWAALRHFPVIQGGKAREVATTSPGRRKNGEKA